MMERVVYLPVQPVIPKWAIKRMVSTVIKTTDPAASSRDSGSAVADQRGDSGRSGSGRDAWAELEDEVDDWDDEDDDEFDEKWEVEEAKRRAENTKLPSRL